MSRTTVRRAAAALLGAAGAIALQVPAHAAAVSAPYTCTDVLGTQSVTIQATLTATPNPAAAGSSVAFALHVSSLGLTSPLTINSWTGSATLVVSGAQSATFQVSGSGGSIAANQTITANMSGTWTPTATGTDQVSGGNVNITANVALLGNVTVACTPVAPAPVGETLTVS
ncbi:MAG TPA: hypothetical protein VJT31_04695 [Rugosimonospora sp.]|nr:hypothetical protein [Rugosimonospora sp.]